MCDLARFEQGETDFSFGQRDRRDRISYPTQLVGRGAEPRELKRLYDRASSGEPQTCVLMGEAGLGKSRLIEELRHACFAEGGLFLIGRCLQLESRSPNQPFRDALDSTTLCQAKQGGRNDVSVAE